VARYHPCSILTFQYYRVTYVLIGTYRNSGEEGRLPPTTSSPPHLLTFSTPFPPSQSPTLSCSLFFISPKTRITAIRTTIKLPLYSHLIGRVSATSRWFLHFAKTEYGTDGERCQVYKVLVLLSSLFTYPATIAAAAAAAAKQPNNVDAETTPRRDDRAR
jgi:hypothetical protein